MKLSRHHRKPRSLGGSNRASNISEVPEHMHRAWHLLFGNKTPEEIASVINHTWLDPDWQMLAVRKSYFDNPFKVNRRIRRKT